MMSDNQIWKAEEHFSKWRQTAGKNKAKARGPASVEYESERTRAEAVSSPMGRIERDSLTTAQESHSCPESDQQGLIGQEG